MLPHHRDSKGKGACWVDQRLSLSQHCSFPHQLRVAQNWKHQIHCDDLKLASFLRATVSIDGGSNNNNKKGKIKFRGEYYQPGKGSMLTWKPYFSPTPSLKILTGPWHSESADMNLSWFRSDPDRILKSPRCPLLNHILTIHWGRLCWEKKNHYPTFTCLFFFEKKFFYMLSISYESDFLTVIFIY